eukprot:jgi/Tetstr1/461609/TSEL_006709.t1
MTHEAGKSMATQATVVAVFPFDTFNMRVTVSKGWAAAIVTVAAPHGVRRLQEALVEAETRQRVCTSIRQAVRRIVATDCGQGLYVGLLPSLCKHVPGMSTQLDVCECPKNT